MYAISRSLNPFIILFRCKRDSRANEFVKILSKDGESFFLRFPGPFARFCGTRELISRLESIFAHQGLINVTSNIGRSPFFKPWSHPLAFLVATPTEIPGNRYLWLLSSICFDQSAVCGTLSDLISVFYLSSFACLLSRSSLIDRFFY